MSEPNLQSVGTKKRWGWNQIFTGSEPIFSAAGTKKVELEPNFHLEPNAEPNAEPNFRTKSENCIFHCILWSLAHLKKFGSLVGSPFGSASWFARWFSIWFRQLVSPIGSAGWSNLQIHRVVNPFEAPCRTPVASKAPGLTPVVSRGVLSSPGLHLRFSIRVAES